MPGGLTADDLSILELAAEHRIVLVTQVQALIGADPEQAELRVSRLQEDGLLRRDAVFHGLPDACRITRRGLGAIGSPLPAPELSFQGYRHDVGLAWLWLAARRGAFGALDGIWSERTMRSEDRRRSRSPDEPADRSWGVGIGAPGPRGGARWHYPDLVLGLPGRGRLAIELELSGKSPRRLDQIMLGYAIDERFGTVLYVCSTAPLGRRIEAAARRAGVADLVHVRRLAAGVPAGTPELGRTASIRASAGAALPASAGSRLRSRPASLSADRAAAEH